MSGLEEVRRRGGSKMCWFDNILQWTGLSGDSGDSLLYAMTDRRCWTSPTHPCSQPSRSDDIGLHFILLYQNSCMKITFIMSQICFFFHPTVDAHYRLSDVQFDP